MKLTFVYIIGFLALFQSCNKSNSTLANSALTIVNAIPESNNLITNFQITNNNKKTDSFGLYGTALQIGYGSFAEFGLPSGITGLSLSQTSDTLQSLFNGIFNLRAGGIYSFFLMGTDTLHIDTMFVKDNIPYYPYTGDSLTGVRVANLVTGSNPVSIDIQGSPNNIPVINSLSYKNISAFQPFSANMNAIANGYIFEFRDVSSGNILATYPLNVLTFKSQTLALYGNSNVGYLIMSINNY
jgi:hypothetical protein